MTLTDLPITRLSRERACLLARIHRRYRTVTRRLRIGDLHLDFTRIEDPDTVLDEVAAEEDRLERTTGHRQTSDSLHLPYWAELWDSAQGIAQWLVNHAPGNEKTLRTLDLGCGMGLSGTVAAAMGHRVLFADLETPALLFARLNAMPYDDARHPIRTRRLNWGTDALDERFDLILGADILYERRQWEPLESFWRRHLADGGLILLGEPGRQTGDGFMDWIGGRGWVLEMVEEPVATRDRPIRLIQLR